MELKNSWTGKILRHTLVALIAVALATVIVYKLFFMPLKKQVTTQNAEKIYNKTTYVTTVKDDEKVFIGVKLPFLFNSKLKLGVTVDKEKKLLNKEE